MPRQPAREVGPAQVPALSPDAGPPALSQAPWWLPGGHAQTIWPALWVRPRHATQVTYRRERWHTPDGDFIDADWSRHGAALPADAPTLVLFHGLEGCSTSPYALAFARWAQHHGWHFVVPHFRGCSGEMNLAPRAYHSGDHVEIGWMLQQVRQRVQGALVAVGVSLGGNALMRWAEEAGSTAALTTRAVAAICAPLNLAAGGRALGRGMGRWVYTPHFLRTMKPKALAKWAQHPGLFDADRLRAARTLYEFDDAFTAPLHGFAGTDDYWSRASAASRLAEVRVPALVLNPRNDPFVPPGSLPGAEAVGACVTLWRPAVGGHCGFAQGPFPGAPTTLTEVVMRWLCQHAGG